MESKLVVLNFQTQCFNSTNTHNNLLLPVVVDYNRLQFLFITKEGPQKCAKQGKIKIQIHKGPQTLSIPLIAALNRLELSEQYLIFILGQTKHYQITTPGT